MVKVTASEVNKLRKTTGAGMMDCKKALVEANGDFDSAIEILRKKGQKVAAKRADRESTEGAAIAKVNDDKTHLLVMSTRQRRRHVDTTTTRIHTPSSSITPSTTERLLGAEIHHNLGWREHILDSEKSMVKSLNKRLGALRKIQKTASFKTRKMIATGIFMSKLIYLMPLWSCSGWGFGQAVMTIW